jgi:DNA-directed RNA polymerase I and III subunit RPAC1
LEIWAEKGIGRNHAKWSPVSTAFYRLLPSIKLNETFDHAKNAEKLVNACPVEVFAMKGQKAEVKNSRKCTTCRECIKLEGV